MKDITLKITGKTVTEDENQEAQEDVIEFVTEGKLYNRAGTTMITYPESEISGFEGWTTYLAIKENKIKMRRSSEDSDMQTIMEFESGKRVNSTYHTPMGNIEMELLTNSISPLAEDENGNSKLSIDYSVSLRGLMESRNTLDIEIYKN